MSEHSEQVHSRMLRGLAAETAKIDFSGIFQTEEDVLASRVRPRFVPPPATSEWTPRDGDRIEYLQDDVWWECDVLMVDSTGVRGKAAGTRPGGQLFVRTVATWAAQWRHRVDRDGAPLFRPWGLEEAAGVGRNRDRAASAEPGEEEQEAAVDE